ncbi:SsgA family sporulation/cell division regulator [Streptomyces sp. NPDC090088]|uniref:SsgA family sporulation/cell division regulator n=1 Tax=Streptomyces sp. NPDC090088 TaxID=3365944 RepID=UPI003815E3E9
MTVRKGMDNVTATEDDDFDALLNASSLGAPHVLAESEPIPDDVYCRLSQAAGSPARPLAEPPVQGKSGCAAESGLPLYVCDDIYDDLLSRLHRLTETMQCGRTALVVWGSASSGKTYSMLQVLHLLRNPCPDTTLLSASWDDWAARPPLRHIVQLRECLTDGFAAAALAREHGIAADDGHTCTSVSRATAVAARLSMLFGTRAEAAEHQTSALCVPGLRLGWMTELLFSARAVTLRDVKALWPACCPSERSREQASLAWPHPRQTAPASEQALLAGDGSKATAGRPLQGASCGRTGTLFSSPFFQLVPFCIEQNELGEKPAACGARPLAECRGGPVPGLPEGTPALTGPVHWLAAPSRTPLLHSMGSAFAGRHPSLPVSHRPWGRGLFLVSHVPQLWLPAQPETEPTASGLSDKEIPAARRRAFGDREEPYGDSGLLVVPGGPRAWIDEAPDGTVLQARLEMAIHREERDEGEALWARVAYRLGDPYAIEVSFYSDGPGEPVMWTFARDLLAEGLDRRTGEGDVVVWSSPEDTPDRERRTFIRLNSPEGTALLSTSRSRLKEYLDRTYRQCATGTEQFHLRQGLDTIESELGGLTCRGLGD